MATTDNSTSRRTVIAALAALPAIGIGGAATAVASTPDRAAWYALKAKYDAAKAREDRHYREVFEPAWDAAKTEVGPQPELIYHEGSLRFDLSRGLSDLLDDKLGAFPPRAVQEEMRARWNAYRARKDRAEEAHGVDEKGRKSDALGDIRCTIEKRLMNMPAPDHEALLWKIDNLWGTEVLDEGAEECAAFDADWCAQVFRDARRLLTAGQA